MTEKCRRGVWYKYSSAERNRDFSSYDQPTQQHPIGDVGDKQLTRAGQMGCSLVR